MTVSSWDNSNKYDHDMPPQFFIMLLLYHYFALSNLVEQPGLRDLSAVNSVSYLQNESPLSL